MPRVHASNVWRAVIAGARSYDTARRSASGIPCSRPRGASSDIDMLLWDGDVGRAEALQTTRYVQAGGPE
jgi:hypothetical protein